MCLQHKDIDQDDKHENNQKKVKYFCSQHHSAHRMNKEGNHQDEYGPTNRSVALHRKHYGDHVYELQVTLSHLIPHQETALPSQGSNLSFTAIAWGNRERVDHLPQNGDGVVFRTERCETGREEVQGNFGRQIHPVSVRVYYDY